MSRGIVLLGHGTKDPEGVAELLACADGLAARSGQPVLAGVLEYPSERLPDIQTAFDRAADAGLDDLVALPALLFFAGHTQGDVPQQVERARARHAGVDIAVAGPLGSDERLLEVVEERLAPFEPDERTAVLLVGRGSLHSEANADLFKTARMLEDRNRFGGVETAFVSLAPPDVAAGLERCHRLGARRVVILPYFLNTGVLVKRIRRQARQAGLDVAVAAHLGLHERVLEVLLARAEQARAGLCPCRAALGCRLSSQTCRRGLPCPA